MTSWPPTEPCIRINVLANLLSLLERNASLVGEGAEFAAENEERLFAIPVKMLVDINLQVCSHKRALASSLNDKMHSQY